MCIAIIAVVAVEKCSLRGHFNYLALADSFFEYMDIWGGVLRSTSNGTDTVEYFETCRKALIQGIPQMKSPMSAAGWVGGVELSFPSAGTIV